MKDLKNFSTYIRDESHDESIKESLSRLGYSIVKDVIPISVIDTLKEFWLSRIIKPDKNAEVVWKPYLGERNSIGHSSDHFQHMFRAVDLPWNEPIHHLTRQLCNELNFIRNRICGLQPDYNLKYRTDNHGMYVSATYYPPGKGYLGKHSDDIEDDNLIHFVVPVTFKGLEYDSGGLFLIDKNGQHVDVDGMMKPGDILFYSGKCHHGVELIQSNRENPIGRIQIFGVPVHFLFPHQVDRMISQIPIIKFSKAKIRQTIRQSLLLMLMVKSAMLRN